MPSRIDTPEYWIDDFRPTEREMEALYGYILETMRPHEIDGLAAVLVRQRVDRVLRARKVKTKPGTAVYRPSDAYKKGQKLVFPALEGAQATVTKVRPGNNPSYGEYQVVSVKIDGDDREFASGITFEHQLTQAELDVDPDVIEKTFAPLVAPQLATRLSSDNEWLAFGHRWVLRALLPEINDGHRNITEAIVMLAGEPMPAAQIVPELDLDAKVPVETRALALDIALADDSRFRNVGAHEAPLWTLKAAGG